MFMGVLAEQEDLVYAVCTVVGSHLRSDGSEQVCSCLYGMGSQPAKQHITAVVDWWSSNSPFVV